MRWYNLASLRGEASTRNSIRTILQEHSVAAVLVVEGTSKPGLHGIATLRVLVAAENDTHIAHLGPVDTM